MPKVRSSLGWLCDKCAKELSLEPVPGVHGTNLTTCDHCGVNSWCLPRCDYKATYKPISLNLACDRKTRAYPTQENTFGLPAGPIEQGGTCPWCTRGPGGCFHIPKGKKNPVCYAWNIEHIFHGAGEKLRQNMEEIKRAEKLGTSVLTEALNLEVSKFIDKCMGYSVKKGIPAEDLLKFRIHWSGDMFSDSYAKAWAEVCRRNPIVTFWTYTRSYDRAKFLVGIPNLKLYLSLDEDSWEKGMCAFFALGGPTNPNLKVAFMSKTEEFVDSCRRKMMDCPERYCPGNAGCVSKWGDLYNAKSKCPVDLGKMELTGACCKCKMCFSPGKQLLWFKC